MKDSREELLATGRQIIERLQNLWSRKQGPIVIALDGGSGAGKSTLASIIKDELDIALIPLDDFFSADIPDDEWDKFTVEEKLMYVFDWNRLRNHALLPLMNGQPAKWHAFDFQSGLRADGTYGMEKEPKRLTPANVILIEGVYSASPALADLIDLSILVNVPVKERYVRLEAREDHDFLEKWHQMWDEVEIYYFSQVRQKNSFDIVIELD
jgi:uridine kinase